jgi:formylglycine-generating enzyme required for sulfatase activity
MKQNKRMSMGAVWVACLCLFMHTTSANNIAVKNVSLVAGDAGYSYVQADISWDNSWKVSWSQNSAGITNWDAAWVFVKFRTVGVTTGNWSHASLSTNTSDHIATNSSATATIDVGVSTNAGGSFGCGVFLHRSAEGHGSWTNTVKLRWNYTSDTGVSSASKVDVNVQAIEMVYVPQGAFYVGSGGTEGGSFTDGSWSSGNTTPLQITSEGALTITNTAGNLWGTATGAVTWTIGTPGTLPAAYPKGFAAFYCMKYEISQGQYTSFLNLLTLSQQSTRCSAVTLGHYMCTTDTLTSPTYRNEVYVQAVPELPTSKVFACTTSNHACNFLSWADVAAYADWAGLRPMTELEFEKACRGPLNGVAGEYAWGNTTIVAVTNLFGTDGSGTETAMPLTANCCSINKVQGPVRCGLFATASSTRTASGATYWGIMEMSGNLWERSVTVADAAGRSFTGTVGDGKLDDTGKANAVSWPITGSGFRGGEWSQTTAGLLNTSERFYGANTTANRDKTYGGRSVRQAPSGLQ